LTLTRLHPYVRHARFPCEDPRENVGVVECGLIDAAQPRDANILMCFFVRDCRPAVLRTIASTQVVFTPRERVCDATTQHNFGGAATYVVTNWKDTLMYHRQSGSARALTATGFINGKWRISTSYRIDSPQPIAKNCHRLCISHSTVKTTRTHPCAFLAFCQ